MTSSSNSPVPSSFAPFESAFKAVARRLKLAQSQDALLARLLRHVSARLVDRQNEALRPYAVNSTTWSALCVLYGNADKGMRPTELSVFMDSSRTNVTRLADELAEKGWVERASDPEDRRQIMLTLTKQGAALVEDTIPQVRDQQQALWASFTKDERQTLDRLLRKLLEQLD